MAVPAASGGEAGWLLSVGDGTESLLAGSRLVVKQLSDAGAPGSRFPSHPRIADPLCGAGWLTCGTAALGFDPLCEDGAGHAVREAIQASAVVRAAGAGGDVDALIAHYQWRLLAGFARHLPGLSGVLRKGRGVFCWARLNPVLGFLVWPSPPPPRPRPPLPPRLAFPPSPPAQFLVICLPSHPPPPPKPFAGGLGARGGTATPPVFIFFSSKSWWGLHFSLF